MFTFVTDEDRKKIDHEDLPPLRRFYYEKTGKIIPPFNYENYPKGAEQYIDAVYQAVRTVSGDQDLGEIRRKYHESTQAK